MSDPTPQPLVFLTHEFFPDKGGIAVYVEETAKAAAALGHKVEVWAPYSARLVVRSAPYKVRTLPLCGNQGWISRLKLLRFLRRHRESWRGGTVFLCEPGPLRAFLYAGFFGLPQPARLLVTFHGSEIRRLCRWQYRKGLLRRLLDRTTGISVLSQFNREALVAAFPELAERITVAPGAARTGLGLRPHESFPQPRTSPDGKLRILTVARIHPRKGQKAVLEAMAQLPPRVKNRLIYCLAGPVGDPDYKRELRTYADKHELDVEFLGEVPDESLAAVYRETDIFAMTSVTQTFSVEGFGLTYLEASACGLPIVAHKSGGVADAVLEKASGELIDPEDRGALAEALRRLAEEPELRRRMGEAGVKWAARFSWKRTARTLFGEPPA